MTPEDPLLRIEHALVRCDASARRAERRRLADELERLLARRPVRRCTHCPTDGRRCTRCLPTDADLLLRELRALVAELRGAS